MAGYILKIDSREQHRLQLESQVEYAAEYVEDELRNQLGLPVQVHQDDPSRYVVVHSPNWKKRYGTFQFRFKIVDHDHIYIDQLFVPEALRDQGIGRACGETITKLSKKLGKSRIYLWSVRESEMFWEKLNFLPASNETWNWIMSNIHKK